jgi:hypothetical protein
MSTNLERQNLLEHGTKAIVLTPSSIVDAAQKDLRRHEHNSAEARTDAPEYEHYAFHRKHVAKAWKAGGHPKNVIELALADLTLGKESGKHWTRVIYSDAELLKKALEAA